MKAANAIRITSLPPAERRAGCVFRRKTRRAAFSRFGLAPVELVLSIPLILMVMALSVIFGNATCWKIRAVVVARNEIWSTRKPRNVTPDDPAPAGWPLTANQNNSGSRSLADLDFAAFQNPLIRGPLPNVAVNSHLLDPTRSVRLGNASIQRTPPMLARLGDYSFNVEHPLLDGTWAYWQTGQYNNGDRRMPDLYPNTPPQDSAERAAYDQAYQAIANASFRPDLAVLDRDEELRAYYGNYFNFHPRIRPTFCSLDANYVRASRIVNNSGLLYQISKVPSTITSRFISMYKAQLQALQNAMPPPAGAQADIALLQQKIQILEDYAATVP